MGKVNPAVDVSSLKEILGRVKAERGRLQGEIEKRLRRREDLESLPLPQSDFADQVVEWTLNYADQYPGILRHKIGAHISTPAQDLNFGGRFNPCTWESERVLEPSFVMFAMRDVVVDAVRKAIMGWDWPAEVGPPRSERKAELGRLDTEIAGLQQQLSELATVGD